MVLCVILLVSAICLTLLLLYWEYPCARVRLFVTDTPATTKRFCDSVALYSDNEAAQTVPPQSTVKLHTSSYRMLQIPKGYIGVAQGAEGIYPFKVMPVLYNAGYHKNDTFILENTSVKEQVLPAHFHFGEIFLRKNAKISPVFVKKD